MKAELSRKLNRFVGLGGQPDTPSLIPRSNSLLVLLTKDLLMTVSCVLEMYTAIRNKVPIITVCVDNGGYDYAASSRQLSSLDEWFKGAADVREKLVESLSQATSQPGEQVNPLPSPHPLNPAPSRPNPTQNHPTPAQTNPLFPIPSHSDSGTLASAEGTLRKPGAYHRYPVATSGRDQSLCRGKEDICLPRAETQA